MDELMTLSVCSMDNLFFSLRSKPAALQLATCACRCCENLSFVLADQILYCSRRWIFELKVGLGFRVEFGVNVLVVIRVCDNSTLWALGLGV